MRRGYSGWLTGGEDRALGSLGSSAWGYAAHVGMAAVVNSRRECPPADCRGVEKRECSPEPAPARWSEQSNTACASWGGSCAGAGNNAVTN